MNEFHHAWCLLPGWLDPRSQLAGEKLQTQSHDDTQKTNCKCLVWYQLCRLPSAVVVIDCCGDKQCAAPFSRDTSLYILSLLTTIMVVHDVGVQQCAAPSTSPGCNKMPYVPHVIDRSWQGPTIHACANKGGHRVILKNIP